MKQTSIQPSLSPSNNIVDPLYSLYLLEVEQRGHNYIHVISMYPNITNGSLSMNVVREFLLRLAFNPSLFSYFQTEDPVEEFQRIVESDHNNVEQNYLYDFIDDVTLNIRMKAEDLYIEKQRILVDQIKKTCAPADKKEKDNLDLIINKLQEYLVTIYYLRKIGYLSELSKTPQKEIAPAN